jgi:hypothetical protein
MSVKYIAKLRSKDHNGPMTRRVNRELLDKWLSNYRDEHSHDAISHLAVQSQVAADTIKKMRASGEAPKKYITCKLLSDAMGLNMDDIFPKEEAS